MQDIPRTSGDTSWFVNDRFGLFIHWGLYALPARHEWIKSRELIPDDVYDSRYFGHFDPDLYDPDLWAQAAANAGMKYFVVTTKHHEGFCLWDSKLTEYKAPNTPAGRDLLQPMVSAFRRQNFRTGLYHSLIDWHHPDYIIDCMNHPRRTELPDIQRDTQGLIGPDAGKAAIPGQDPNRHRNHQKYIEYLHGQVRELLTGYGHIDIMWFDFSFVRNPEQPRDDLRYNKGREAWGSEQLYETIRQLAPHVILNDRLDLPGGHGDVVTPEQYQPRGQVCVDGQPVVWEACQTFSGSWGYHRDEHTWRDTDELIRTLIDCVSKGGNLLLNVGPTGRGEFDERALDRLAGIGRWMRRHSRSIYGCTAAPEDMIAPPDTRLTYNPHTNRLYVHLFAYPYKHLVFNNMAQRVEYAQFLHDASELTGPTMHYTLRMNIDAEHLVLNLPQMRPHNIDVPVIELFLK